MKVGCFALIDPFSLLEHQLDRIAEMGFKYADVTENSDGADLGVGFGFAAVASLDANPHDLRRMFESRGLTITSFCAHSLLLDPPAPWRYGSSQIIKAVRAAAAMGVSHVITTEGEPHTAYGEKLTEEQGVFTIAQKLYEPLRVAADFGVKLLLEPHGPYTDSVERMEMILDRCDSDALGINLDTGNLWLGGGDPVAFVKKLGEKIEHVHWKDMPAELESKRGSVFGAGMATIPLGGGAVDIAGTVTALKAAGFDGYTTLEVAGDAALKESVDYLRAQGAV